MPPANTAALCRDGPRTPVHTASAAHAAAVPNIAAINPGRTAAMLICCIAATPAEGWSRRSPRMMKVEKP